MPPASLGFGLESIVKIGLDDNPSLCEFDSVELLSISGFFGHIFGYIFIHFKSQIQEIWLLEHVLRL